MDDDMDMEPTPPLPAVESTVVGDAAASLPLVAPQLVEPMPATAGRSLQAVMDPSQAHTPVLGTMSQQEEAADGYGGNQDDDIFREVLADPLVDLGDDVDQDDDIYSIFKET